MSLYRTILKRAWDNAWHHKYLWFFGLFAALLGNGGELELIFGSYDRQGQETFFPAWQRFAETGLFSKAGLSNMVHLAQTEPASLFFALTVLLVIILLAIFLLWLCIVSQTAIVHNTAKIKHDKEHDFKDGLMQGIKKFWPVLGLNLIIKMITAVLFFLIGVPVVMGIVKTNTAINLSYVLMFIIFIPISLSLSFILKYAISYTIIKGQKFFESIKSGWILFKNNWLISIEMAILLFFINFLVGIAVLLAFLVLAIPLLLVMMIFSQSLAIINFWLFFMTALILLLLMIVFIGSLLSTFQISAWTHLFMELIGKGGTSKLARIFSKEK